MKFYFIDQEGYIAEVADEAADSFLVALTLANESGDVIRVLLAHEVGTVHPNPAKVGMANEPAEERVETGVNDAD